MTGVKNRYIAVEEQTSSDLCYEAVERLLENLRLDKKTIDAVILVTQTPDYRLPATACVLHKRLGLKHDCIAFDVNLGCSGYVYGIYLTASLLRNSSMKRALLLAGDTLNKCISDEDKSTSMLFGDSGSATVLEMTNDNTNVIKYLLQTDGNGFKHIIVSSGEFRNKNGKKDKYEFIEGIIRSDFDLYMSGVDVFNFTINEVADSIIEFSELFDIKNDDIDMYVLHQANTYILKTVAKKTNIPINKLPISMDRFGNTSVTSIPLTICDACEKQGIDNKLNLMCVGFCVGLSWGVLSMKIDTKNCLPIIFTNNYFTEGGIECFG